MEKEIGTIRVTETDKGIKIEIEGDLKERFSQGCCFPIAACCCQSDNCCSDNKKQ